MKRSAQAKRAQLKSTNRPRPGRLPADESSLTRLYFTEMEAYDLLSAEEEQALGLAIRESQDELLKLAADKAEEIPGLARLKPLTSCWRSIERTSHASIEGLLAEIRTAFSQYAAKKPTSPQARRLKKRVDGIEARMQEAIQRMVEANLRLAVNMAKRYTFRRLPFNDLIQEANIGLMKAAARYNYRTGYRFSTFASWWIRQSISRAIYDQARTIRIPVHCLELRARIFKAYYSLKRECGREPTAEEIAKRLGQPITKVIAALEIIDETLSLDSPVGQDGDALGDFIKDEACPDPFEAVRDMELVDLTRQAINGLDEREQKILTLRYGLADGRTRTLEEVGRVFSLSRERIRQIEKRALLRLRGPMGEEEAQGESLALH